MPYYSKATGGFYHDAIHNQIPMDRVEITDERHRALLEANHTGKIIVGDENGFPTAVDAPKRARTSAQQIEAIEAAITPRRLREAVLGTDDGWLEAQEATIARLRAKIKS